MRLLFDLSRQARRRIEKTAARDQRRKATSQAVLAGQYDVAYCRNYVAPAKAVVSFLAQTDEIKVLQEQLEAAPAGLFLGIE